MGRMGCVREICLFHTCESHCARPAYNKSWPMGRVPAQATPARVATPVRDVARAVRACAPSRFPTRVSFSFREPLGGVSLLAVSLLAVS